MVGAETLLVPVKSRAGTEVMCVGGHFSAETRARFDTSERAACCVVDQAGRH